MTTDTRYAVLSDVHGNLPALEATLAALAGQRIDRYLCAGDLVGYGPFPNQCVEVMASLPGVGIAGNHDLIALGRLTDDRCTPSARRSLAWTRTVLTDATRDYLATLPERAAIDGVVLSHGSLDDPSEYVTQPGQADAQLARLARDDPEARILVLGHTHRPWAYNTDSGTLLRQAPGTIALEAGERYLVNPGSVGQSRDTSPDARFAVIDAGSGRVEFHSIRYDIEACRKALRALGLPPDACHYRAPARKRAKWALRRLVRRLGV
ncbi:MAG TPA: metallophosphoesterase family protein [Acidimicrobiales bacterium]|nr:metallophosphoesterase family protein [Acidimicrobiales bacterium]